MPSRRFDRLWPLAVFLVALLVRLPGLGWGLKNDLRNASLHPDETPNFIYSRAVTPALGRLTPGFYSYGTLYLSALSIAEDVSSGYTGGPKTREGWSPADPTQTDWDWVSRCILAGRILSALAGAAAAAIAFALGRRVAGSVAGGLAGAFVGLAPAFVVHSRFSTPDALSTALIGGALYFAVRALDPKDEKARLSPAVWCGILSGLACGVKYTGILVLLGLYVALALSKRPKAAAEGLIATVVAGVVFLLTTPGVLLDTERFLHDFKFEMQHTATGQELFFAGTSSGFVYHLANLAVGVGPLLLAMALAGLGWAAYRRHPWALVVLAFLLPYYLLIGRAEVKYMRYTFPLYVGLAAGFGYAVTVAQRRKGVGMAATAACALGLAGIPDGGLRGTVGLTLAMTGEDPRDAAGRYLHANATAVGLARDPWYWTASVVPDGAGPRGPLFWPAIRAEILASSSLKVVYPLTPEGTQTYFDPATFDQKPDRIATSNFERDYPLALRGKTGLTPDQQAQVNGAVAWLDRLTADYEIEKVFENRDRRTGIEDMDYVAPQVIVWKRKTP